METQLLQRIRVTPCDESLFYYADYFESYTNKSQACGGCVHTEDNT